MLGSVRGYLQQFRCPSVAGHLVVYTLDEANRAVIVVRVIDARRDLAAIEVEP